MFNLNVFRFAGVESGFHPEPRFLGMFRVISIFDFRFHLILMMNRDSILAFYYVVCVLYGFN